MNKENIMKKYKVTNEFMDELKEWNENHKYPDGTTLINQHTLNELPEDVTEWLFETGTTLSERNRRYGAIVNWINGEDTFEVGKTHKFGVRSVNNYYGGNLWLRVRFFEDGVGLPSYNNLLLDATLFAKRDEAELWTTNGFEVVEVDE